MPLSLQVRHLEDPGRAYTFCMDIIGRLAAKGLVHCDFNEFNLLINPDDENITVIDFPQVGRTHIPALADGAGSAALVTCLDN